MKKPRSSKKPPEDPGEKPSLLEKLFSPKKPDKEQNPVAAMAGLTDALTASPSILSASLDHSSATEYYKRWAEIAKTLTPSAPVRIKAYDVEPAEESPGTGKSGVPSLLEWIGGMGGLECTGGMGGLEAPSPLTVSPEDEPLLTDATVLSLARMDVKFFRNRDDSWTLWMPSAEERFGVELTSRRDKTTGGVTIEGMDSLVEFVSPECPEYVFDCDDVERKACAGEHWPSLDVRQCILLAGIARSELSKATVLKAGLTLENLSHLLGVAQALEDWSKNLEKRMSREFTGITVSPPEDTGELSSVSEMIRKSSLFAPVTTGETLSYLDRPEDICVAATSSTAGLYACPGPSVTLPEPLTTGICCVARYWPAFSQDEIRVEMALGIACVPDCLIVSEDGDGRLSVRLDSSVVPVDRVMKPVGGGQAEEAIAFLHDPNISDGSKKRMLGIMAGALSAVNDAERHSPMLHRSPHWQPCWLPALEEVRRRAIGYAAEHGISLPEYGDGLPEEGVVTEVILDDETGFGTAFRKGMPILLTDAGREAWRHGGEYIEVVSPADGTSVMLARTRLKTPDPAADIS